MGRIRAIRVYPKWVDVTVRVKSQEEVGRLAEILTRTHGESIQGMRSFQLNGSYLNVKVRTFTLDKALGMLCEHGEEVYIGRVMPAILREHGVEIKL